jgi:predicted Zn finger-like uncharacterized protein
MRLSCPTCGALYDLPDDRLPAGGSHVQCSECHSRWFVRARAAETEPPSEEQIIARLETRVARGGPAGGPPPSPRPGPARPAGGPAAPIAFPGATRPRPPAEADALRPEAEAPPAAAEPGGRPAAGPAAGPQPGSAPGHRPAAPPPAPAAPPAATTPLRPRARGAEEPPAVRAPDRAAPPRRSGAAAGAFVALTLAAAGLGVYLRADDLATRAPAAAPALARYVDGVDAARDWVEARLGPLRDRLTQAGPEA